MNKYKNGFTLVEIIISISIISIIGLFSIISINQYNNKKESDVLSRNEKALNNSLETYLSVNKDIINNINTKSKGIIITLAILKKEGLISDNIALSNEELRKNYFLISNSVLAPSGSDISCDKNQVSLATISSWNVDTDKVIYICATNKSNRTLSSDIPKGGNPNNYVINNYNGHIYKYRILEIDNNNIFLFGIDDKHINVNKSNITSFIKSNTINETNYYKEYESDNGHYGIDFSHLEGYTSKIGTINYSNILNATSTTGNWLLSDISKILNASSIKCFFIEYYAPNGKYYISLSDETSYVVHSFSEQTAISLPIIKINEACAFIEEQADCSDYGSETCPYILNDINC